MCAGSRFANRRGMNPDVKANVNDATELLVRAGARECARCGMQSLIPAHDSGEQLWFCFECGNQEQQLSTAFARYDAAD
jgi:ribosomal protein S27AE